jgi:hypothetical protein
MRQKILLLLAAILVIHSGCKKYLDLPPKNVRTVSSVIDIKSLMGAYLRGVANERVAGIYGSAMPMAPALANVLFESYSDNIDFETALNQTYLKPNNASTRNEAVYADLLLWNQFSTPDFLWKNHYSVIGYLNAIIDNMDQISDATPQERDQLLGELYTHRAYYFFKLLQYYAPYDKADLGIPVYLNTGQGVVGINLSRKSHAEVYKVILNDLNKALDMVGKTTPLTGFNVFYSKRYINHTLAQVYWFKAESPAKESSDYEKVKTHALAALEGVDPFIPTTATGMINAYSKSDPNYPAHCMINNQQNQIGIIYGANFQYLNPGQYGPENIPLTAEFSNLFVPTDIRIEAYFNMVSTRAGGKVGTAGRTLGWQWPTDGTMLGQGKWGNSCLFKPEEAYLMLAEAYLRLNDVANSISTLNKFKAFRKAGTVSGISGQQLLTEIINERRREFFGDSDKRWLDLKRYGNKTITRNITFFQKPYSISVPPNDYRYALPIPISEVQVNPNIIPNPGWVTIQY